ncbi:MAG: recombinase family protein [Cyanobium sp. D14.bin.5]|nr:recombinase family protein [Cyanobium sp. D14.bin.5]
MLAVPYSRVSTGEQAQSGLGLTRQQEGLAIYCEARGWRLWEGSGYSDRGVSGYSGANVAGGALGRFLADLKRGAFGPPPLALLIEDVDRFSRDFPLNVLPVLIEDLLNAGVAVAVLSKGRDFSRDSIRANPMELHELLLWLQSAHDFSARLSRRLEHVHQNKRERVRRGEAVTPGMAPSWLELGPDGLWHFTPYAEVVRQVLKLAESQGCSLISQKMNQEEIPCPGEMMRRRQKGRNGEPRALSWNSATVRQLIVHPAIRGARRVVEPGHQKRVRQWREQCALLRRQGLADSDLPNRPQRTHQQPQESYYPPLITAAEQSGLIATMGRRRLDTKGRTDQVKWIASGLTTCICGAPMGAIGGGMKRGRSGLYLRCKAVAKGLGCRSPLVKMIDAQANLLTRITSDTFTSLLAPDTGASRLAPLLIEQASAQGELDHLLAAVGAGTRALEAETSSEVVGILARRQAALEAKSDVARERLAAAQAALQQLQNGPSTGELAAGLQARVRGLLQGFADGSDTPEIRRGLREHLRQIGLRVSLDAARQKLGLAVGEGAVIWQPIHGGLAKAALKRGQPGVQYGTVHISAEALRVAMDSGRSVDGMVRVEVHVIEGDLRPGEFDAEIDFP